MIFESINKGNNFTFVKGLCKHELSANFTLSLKPFVFKGLLLHRKQSLSINSPRNLQTRLYDSLKSDFSRAFD